MGRFQAVVVLALVGLVLGWISPAVAILYLGFSRAVFSSPDGWLTGSHSRACSRKMKQSLSIDVRLIANLDATVPDNHFPPMKPAQYITARLLPMLSYYQGRVPKKYRQWKGTVFSLLAID